MFSRSIIFSLFIIVVSANFQLKLGPCEFKCSNQCEKKPMMKGEPTIKDYYWRNFDGNIPKDALPAYDLDKPTNPKTYIGLSYYPEDNSLYTATIVEGLDYVYMVTSDGTVVKTSENIQILCTQEPEKFEWVTLTAGGNLIYGPVNGGCEGKRGDPKFVSRSRTCGINYVSSVKGRTANMSYATMDGNSRDIAAHHYEFLNYKEDAEEKPMRSKPEHKKSTLFAHRSEYSINPKSIIPHFYKKIRVGSCSFTCTDRNPDKMDSYHHNLDYYWKPINFPHEKDGVIFGKTYTGASIFIAQTWTKFGIDMGYFSRDTVYIPYNQFTAAQTTGNILASINQDKFKWVPSNSTQFETLDKSNMVQGGIFSNGSKIYVGRVHVRGDTFPGVIRTSNGIAYTYSYNTVSFYSDDFDVYTFNG